MQTWLLVLYCIVNIPFSACSMELQNLPVELHAVGRRSSVENLSIQPELGGACATLQGFDRIQFYEQLKELTLLMGALVDGIVIRDHAIVLPGRAYTIPLAVASAWINGALDQASEYTYNGKPLIDSDDPVICKCQTAQKRLWEFMVGADLLQSGPDSRQLKEKLYRHRLLRITALINKNESILKKYAQSPVFLKNKGAEHVSPGTLAQAVDVQFLATSVPVSAASQARQRSARCCSCCVLPTH